MVDDPAGSTMPLSLVTPKFESSRDSGLTIKVDGSKKTFDFSVDRNAETVAKLKQAKAK